jgi:membrane protease YdiL (CAAX protease family)
MEIKHNIFLRLCISFLAVILPIISLAYGVYGSFLFTFSIPLVWQVGLRGMSFRSLGLRRAAIWKVVVVGGLTGCFLGVAGGVSLRLLGITGRSFSDLHALRLAFGPWNASFPLNNELGYRLLSVSNSGTGLCVYLVFSIFVIGLGEELFWRGFIQQKINRYLSTGRSVIVTSILFALIHFYVFTILDLRAGSVVLLLIAIAGGVWGFLLSKSGSIWQSAVSHGIGAFILWKYFFFA